PREASPLLPAPAWAALCGALSTSAPPPRQTPVQPRTTTADPRIDAVRGTLAVERGPLVLCLESVDLPDGVALEQVRLPSTAPLAPEGDGARVDVRVVALPDERPGALPFGTLSEASGSHGGEGPDRAGEATAQVCLVPYHRWAERGPSRMRIVLPTTCRTSFTHRRRPRDRTGRPLGPQQRTPADLDWGG